MTRYKPTVNGLTVKKVSNGWRVVHEASGVTVWGSGLLRQRRFAEQARDELLATGVDFTRPRSEMTAHREAIGPILGRWNERTRQQYYDDTTYEYYPTHISYGTFVPSAAWAAAMRTATTPGSYDGEAVERLLNKGNKAVRA